MKFKKALITTDLSPHSLATVTSAGQLLKGSEITLLTIVRPPPIPMGTDLSHSMQLSEIIRERMVQEATPVLHAVASEALSGIEVKERVVLSLESVAHAIKQCARDGNFDLIVVGSRRAGQLERMILGTTARRILKLAECPVLVVPEASASSENYKPVSLEKLVVATDLSEASSKSIKFMSKYLAGTRRIDLVSVFSLGAAAGWPFEFLKSATPYLEYLEQRIPLAESKLEELASNLASCPEVNTRVLQSDRKVSEELCEYAYSIVADCLVLGSQGAGVLQNLFLGSTVVNVLKQASIPVLVNPCRD